MRIVRLEEIREELKRHIRSNALFPIIGSGFTKGCRTKLHDQVVPSGSQMKDYMIRYLFDHGHVVSSETSFSRVARYYEVVASQEDFWHYFRDHFTNVELSDPQKTFLSVNWKYVYTLNLDDAIEHNSRYSDVILPNRSIRLDALEPYRCVFKLHGDAHELVKYREKNRAVLSIIEYISSLSESKSMLEKLTEDLNYTNAIFVGCSLREELDLLSVAHEVNAKNKAQINRYYVTKTAPSEIDQMDLSDYGIDTIILVEEYDSFYYQFAKLAEECEFIPADEIDLYRDFSIAEAPSKKSVDYLVSGRYLLDMKSHTVFFPKYFIERDTEADVLSDMHEERLQIIYGARISGKSYFLAGLLKKIKNRDVYYFDSRSHIDASLLKKLLDKYHCVLLIDTNVLDREAIKLLFNSTKILLSKDINVILCVNNSDRDILQMIRDNQHEGKTSHVKSYPLGKRFSCAKSGKTEIKEVENLNEKLKLEGIIPFERTQTILDNLIKIQSYMRAKAPTRFDDPISVPVGNTKKMSLIIMLVLYEKVTAHELVRCGLMQANTELLKELKITIEEDHCQLLSIENIDLVSYQVVCNANVWLLDQLRLLSTKSQYHKTIIDAFSHIIQSYLDGSKRYKTVEDFVKFDRLNELFPNGKRLIQDIYDGLRPLLYDSYQYYHQYAKCRSWGMSTSRYSMEELNKARIAGITALQMVKEYNIEEDFIHHMAYAHILNTVSIIYAKMCFLESFYEKQTVVDTCQYLLLTIKCPENYLAMQSAKHTKNKSRDEDGGVIKKWVEYMLHYSSDFEPEIKRYFAVILQYWRNL